LDGALSQTRGCKQGGQQTMSLIGNAVVAVARDWGGHLMCIRHQPVVREQIVWGCCVVSGEKCWGESLSMCLPIRWISPNLKVLYACGLPPRGICWRNPLQKRRRVMCCCFACAMALWPSIWSFRAVQGPTPALFTHILGKGWSKARCVPHGRAVLWHGFHFLKETVLL
jgi:hypothetical protein